MTQPHRLYGTLSSSRVSAGARQRNALNPSTLYSGAQYHHAVASLFVALLGLLTPGCSDKSQPSCVAGSEGCACYGNLTCDGNLACRSSLCVSLTSTSKQDQSGSKGGSDECGTCGEKSCASDWKACTDTAECADIAGCLIDCHDGSCSTACPITNVTASSKAATYVACTYQKCSKECLGVATPSVSTGSSTSSAAASCLSCGKNSAKCSSSYSKCQSTTGCVEVTNCTAACSDNTCASTCFSSASTDAVTSAADFLSCATQACPTECGADSVAPSSMPSTGTSKPANPSTPATANVPTTPSSSVPSSGTGTHWLSLVANGAPSTEQANADFGIEGVFYTYDDGCSSISWSPTSRCLTGDLCSLSATSWGAGIGFDFRNDGTTKYAWDAGTAGAKPVRGLSWQASALGAGFQVWITNIDPSAGAMCDAKVDCGINGPPDGDRSPSEIDSILFTGLRKDDWGGTGTAYTFDSKKILSVQFKVPALSVPTSFQLCVDQLGLEL
jgi:hypothetical protein